MNDEDFEDIAYHVHPHYMKKLEDLEAHLREYLDVMSTEPESLIPLSKVYHDLKRILGDEA